MQPFLTVIAMLVGYGVLHSLLAAIATKKFVHQWLGTRLYEGWYRLFFNAVAGITFLPILAYVGMNSGDSIWRSSPPWSYGLLAIQLAGLVGLTVSLLQIDGWRFLGISQILAWFNGDPLPLPDEPLQIKGVYRLVRHPLYLFSMMVLWALPVMSAASLGLATGTTLYFIVGSYFEEKKLHAAFGEAYAQYQRDVPWMIPFLKISS